MKDFIRTTELESQYHHLEKMTIAELLTNINDEDKTVPFAIEKAVPQIEALVKVIVDKMLAGGRLFYMGAGSSGRSCIVDASECPPTFGVPYDLVVGIIAGGDVAMVKAIEFAEDNETQGWLDLQQHNISNKDVVIGVAASGTTPYVISALKKCRQHNIVTACLTANAGSPVTEVADYIIEVVTGPEFVTGSTRMKCGTAQKLVLNMISTTVMIQLGRVEDNSMVNMQLTNDKLVDRGTRMLMEKANIIDYEAAKNLLLQHGSVKKATDTIDVNLK